MLLVPFGGCSLETSVLPPADGGMDASTDSELPDGWLPDVMIDAGPPCTEFGEREVVAILSGETLLRTTGVLFEDTVWEEPFNVALSANRYRYGAWYLEGYEDALLGEPPSFADLDARPATAHAFRSALEASDDGDDGMFDLLLDRDGTYTIAFFGELRLSAGDNVVHADVDDRVLLAVDVDGTPVATSRNDVGEASLTVTVPRDDWYPVRGLFHNGGGPGLLSIELTPPGGSRRAVEAAELRVDALQLRGREVHGWQSREGDGDPLGSRVERGPTEWESSGAEYPGVGLTDQDDWSVTWAGRYVVPDAFDDFAVEADAEHRLFVDGVFLGGSFGSNSDYGLYESHAADGTIDVVAGLGDGNGGSRLRLLFDEVPFEAGALRPATRFGGVPYGRGAEFDHTVGTSRTEGLDLPIPDGRPSAVEVSVVVRTENPAAVRVSVRAPNGMTDERGLEEGSWVREPDLWNLHWVPSFTSGLESAAGTWEITVSKVDDTDSVHWLRQGVLAHIGGVPAPYAERGSFRTHFVDLGDATEILGVRAGGVIRDAADVRLSVRAGATPAAVDAMPYVDTNRLGDLPSPLEGRFVQIRAELSGPGWDTPRIRDLRVVGRRCRRCAELSPPACPEERTSDGLVGLWLFDEEEAAGNRVRDQSGFHVYDLILPSIGGWRREADHVVVEEAAPIMVERPIDGMREALINENALTIEAWVIPENTDQDGPARILTISQSPNEQNLALGQDRDRYEGRVRVEPDQNPISVPSAEGAVEVALQHVVMTRGTDGRSQIWVDGVMSGDPVDTSGTLTSWDPSYRIYLANERTSDRPWKGELHLVALYDRALDGEEIARHHRIGPRVVAEAP